MITQLLTPKGNSEVKTKIEDLSGDNNDDEQNVDADQESDEEEMDWYFEQVLNLKKEYIFFMGSPAKREGGC